MKKIYLFFLVALLSMFSIVVLAENKDTHKHSFSVASPGSVEESRFHCVIEEVSIEQKALYAFAHVFGKPQFTTNLHISLDLRGPSSANLLFPTKEYYQADNPYASRLVTVIDDKGNNLIENDKIIMWEYHTLSTFDFLSRPWEPQNMELASVSINNLDSPSSGAKELAKIEGYLIAQEVDQEDTVMVKPLSKYLGHKIIIGDDIAELTFTRIEDKIEFILCWLVGQDPKPYLAIDFYEENDKRLEKGAVGATAISHGTKFQFTLKRPTPQELPRVHYAVIHFSTKTREIKIPFSFCNILLPPEYVAVDSSMPSLEVLRKYAESYEPTPKEGHTIPVLPMPPQNVVTEIEKVRESNYENCGKYITLIMLKLNRYYLENCHQSYDLRRHGTSGFLIDNPILLAFCNLARIDIDEAGKEEFLSSWLVMDWISLHSYYRRYLPIKNEVERIEEVQRKIKRGDFWK